MSTDKTVLGDRMKRYERAHRILLVPRMPIIIRIDGTAFHTLTRGLKRPVDERIVNAMNYTAVELCRRLQGTCFAYAQSDEISILLVDYKKLNSQGWFNNNLQKMTAVSASMAGALFTTYLREHAGIEKTGFFDSRVIQIPREDVENYFVWRQRDCIRNSILGLGQKHLSHQRIQGKNKDEICALLLEEKGINWHEDIPSAQRYGYTVERVLTKTMQKNKKTKKMEESVRAFWVATASPDYSSEGARRCVNEYLYPESEQTDAE